ncbi:MAG: methionyl-tRNA formyltransferase [Lachnospiraceae bacterium]
MRIIFMGTPDFSVGTLEALIGAGHEVVLCVTQPDKPKGRGKEVQSSPVKQAALAHEIPVLQPKKIREESVIQELKTYQADVIVVVAFGQILTKEILCMPNYGCINVHASLLPKYRGAAPIQWAVMNGEKVTGVTTMRMDEGVDTGDRILSREVPLAKEETGGSLFEKLMKVGAELCVETLQLLEENKAQFQPQDHTKATKTVLIKKELGQIQWQNSAETIERLIRGLNPWPSAYTTINGKTLKLWKATSVSGENCMPPGTIVEVGSDSFTVATGEGKLEVQEVQLEGKKRMSTKEFLRGHSIIVGMELK